MTELKRPYVAVRGPEGLSVGGSQMWLEKRALRRYGCGLIAAADLLWYLGLDGPGGEREEDGRRVAELGAYRAYVARLARSFPVLGRFGMPGWLLAAALTRAFFRRGARRFAVWGAWSWDRDAAMERMLGADVPVILSIGPNFPWPWGKRTVTLYRRDAGGRFLAAARTRAHYLTVFGMDPDWYRVSSWGREYFVSRLEYREYIRKYSCGLYSNICRIGAAGGSRRAGIF